MPLSWRVHYNNGDIISQSPDYAYEDIDRDNLIAFQIVDSDKVVFSVPFFDGQGKRLIWRRRIEREVGGTEKIVHIVGKKGGFVCAVFDDGSILADDKFRDDNNWLYPPQYREYEVE
jgi:hypothetical protein